MNNYISQNYDPTLVLFSLLIAILASFSSFSILERSRTNDSILRILWLFIGSIIFGTGIWSMHFLGMIALDINIKLYYDIKETFFSWFLAVLAAFLALSVSSTDKITKYKFIESSFLLATAICAMHYTGMAALDVVPRIYWNYNWIIISIIIAIIASFAALFFLFSLRENQQLFLFFQPIKSKFNIFTLRLFASIIMGIGIVLLHYSAMMASNFHLGTLCLNSSKGLDPANLIALVSIGSVLLISAAFITALVEARLESKINLLNQSLSISNQTLEKTMENLKEAQVELLYAEKTKALSFFNMNLSHEINTPLANARLFNSSLNQKILAFEQNLNAIKKSDLLSLLSQTKTATQEIDQSLLIINQHLVKFSNIMNAHKNKTKEMFHFVDFTNSFNQQHQFFFQQNNIPSPIIMHDNDFTISSYPFVFVQLYNELFSFYKTVPQLNTPFTFKIFHPLNQTHFNLEIHLTQENIEFNPQDFYFLEPLLNNFLGGSYKIELNNGFRLYLSLMVNSPLGN